MDAATYILCKSSAKKYTDQVTQSLMGGVHYRGSVNYYANLPNDAQEGDSYTVKYAGTSGSIADGTEYTWGYDTDSQTYAWINFSKDAYSKAETDDTFVKKVDEYNAGKTVPKGTTVTFRGQTYTVADNAEIFNSYSNNIATGGNSHAEGVSTTATGQQAHAEGAGTWASGYISHAEGAGTTASGGCSHAEGGGTTASGNNSHAEGNNTTASGMSSHAEGGNTTADGMSSHAEGAGTKAMGSCSHAEGAGTVASVNNSHAEGRETTASGEASHAEGAGTVASGGCSHAEGGGAKAMGTASHAEGAGTTASGDGSHTEGANSKATGKYSHAEGESATANGANSHAEGTWTIASSDYQHVEGKYNIEDANNKFAHIIGNGTGNARSNAFAIDWDGKIYTHNSATGFDINSNYLEMPNGIRLYISATTPTGDIPDGSLGVGW